MAQSFVLNSPELLIKIFENLDDDWDDKTLSQAIQVNQQWFRCAAPVFWKDADVCDLSVIHSMQRKQFYANFVQRMTLIAGSAWHSYLSSGKRPTHEPEPNLLFTETNVWWLEQFMEFEFLDLNFPALKEVVLDQSVFKQFNIAPGVARYLMFPNITSFQYTLAGEDAAKWVLKALGQTCHRLEELSLYNSVGTYREFEDCIKDFFAAGSNKSSLKHIRLENQLLGAVSLEATTSLELLEHLARYRNLEQLDLTSTVEADVLEEVLSRVKKPFPKLRSFETGLRLDDSGRAMEHLAKLLQQSGVLSRLRIVTAALGDNSPSAFIRATLTRFPKLTALQLEVKNMSDISDAESRALEELKCVTKVLSMGDCLTIRVER